MADESPNVRSEERIARLLERVAAVEAENAQYKRAAEDAAKTDGAKAIEALNAKLATLVKERDDARKSLVDAQSGWETERVTLALGVSEPSDIAALRALHGVYGADAKFGDWLNDQEKLPAAAKALIPAPAAEGGEQVKPDQGQPAGRKVREQGGAGPGAGKPRTISQIAAMSPAELTAEVRRLGTSGDSTDLRAGFESLVRSALKPDPGA